MIEADDSPTSTYDDSLRQLRRSVRELEKVNHQFAQLLDGLDGQASNIQKHSPPCQAPHLARNPQQVIPTILPPALNPPACPILASPVAPLPDQRPPIMLPDPAAIIPDPQRDDAPQIVPPMAPPPAPNLPASPSQSQTQQSSPADRHHRTIPNWAQPAVPIPASQMAGMYCTGKKPPPRPDRKPIPFKRKPQTKPHAANQKDFLRPP